MTGQLQQAVCSFPKEETVYRVLITDTPQPKEHTYLCQALLKERRDTAGIYPIGHTAVLYLQQDSSASCLKSGDELLISARISPPLNNRNFDEFDYARFLMRKSISGTGYVASGKWTILSSSKLPSSSANPSISLRQDEMNNFDLKSVASSCRRNVVSLYQELGFIGDELAVLSALTIGDKTELSDSVRESYSVAGASHILALSGLHIGLLYTMIFFILKPVARRGNIGRCVRSVFLLVLLWTFAFFTGLSPSDSAYILGDTYGITVRAGLHCSPLIHQAMGTGARGTVRVSVSWFTTEEEIRSFIKAAEEIAESLTGVF